MAGSVRGASSAPSWGHTPRLRVILFALVGLVVAVFSAALLALGVEVLALPLWAAYTFQLVVAVNLNFVLNDRLTWGDRRLATPLPLAKRWLLFTGGRLGSVAATTGLFVLFATVWPYLMAHVTSIGAVAVVNYLFNDLFVFRSHSTRRPWSVWSIDLETVSQYDVSVVLPVKGNSSTVAGTVDSLLRQDFEGDIHVVVVVDVDDPSFVVLDGLFTGVPNLEFVHPSFAFPLKGRDANYRRALGVAVAKAPVVAMVDADMVYPPNWASTGLALLDRHPEVDVVLGTVSSAQPDRFWQRYVDTNPWASKTPRWPAEVFIDVSNFGAGSAKPGITANLFARVSVFSRAGLPRPDFTFTYDDYAFLYDVVSSGSVLLCTPELFGSHFHRDTLSALWGEYVSAGQGCADFVWSYPASPFSRKRLTQLLSVVALSVCAVAALALDPRLFLAASLVAVMAAGLLTAWLVRSLHGLGFPLATLVLGAAFVFGFVRGLFRAGPPSLDTLPRLTQEPPSLSKASSEAVSPHPVP